MSKSEFVRTLQVVDQPLHPFDISQRIRKLHGCVSVCQFDPRLDIKRYRGYMVRYREKPNRTPENPELYVCVVATSQSMQWQLLVWTKEILGILDSPDQRTKNKESLGHMLDSRHPVRAEWEGKHANVRADRNGVALALGCAVPHAYREILRTQHLPRVKLAALLPIPDELLDWLISPEFETDFEKALAECDRASAI